MDDITALMGVTKDPKEQQIADALRNKQKTGNFFSMSTIDPISQMGSNMSNEANTAARVGGGLIQSRKELAQRQAEKTAAGEAETARLTETQRHNAAMEANAEANTTSLVNYRKATTDAQKAELEAKKAEKAGAADELIKNGHSGKTPPASLVKTYQGNQNNIKRIGRIAEKFKAFAPEQMKQVDQAFADATIKFLTPDDMTQWMRENMLYSDPDVRNFFSEGYALENNISRIMSGLAVTGFEMSARKDWSPFAGGISPEERAIRLQNVDVAMKDEAGEFEYAYGDKWNSGLAPTDATDGLADSVNSILDGPSTNKYIKDKNLDTNSIQSYLDGVGDINTMDDAQLDAAIAQAEALVRGGVRK